MSALQVQLDDTEAIGYLVPLKISQNSTGTPSGYRLYDLLRPHLCDRVIKLIV